MTLLFHPQNYSVCCLVEPVFKDEESMQQTLWCFLAVPWLNHLFETILPNSRACICPHQLNQNHTREEQSFMWGKCISVISGLIWDPPCLVCHCLLPHFCRNTEAEINISLKKIKLTNIPVRIRDGLTSPLPSWRTTDRWWLLREVESLRAWLLIR